MERVCLVMASQMWIEGVVPECGRHGKELRLQDGEAKAMLMLG